MTPQPTHREVPQPEIAARELADYMVASETGRRAILRDAKYPPLQRSVRYDEARRLVAAFLIGGGGRNVGLLAGEAAALRARAAQEEAERERLEHNAEYLERFAMVHEALALPEAEILPPGPPLALDLNGVHVPVELQFRLRRTTRAKTLRIGAGMLRYRRGRTAPVEAALWQSALLLGALRAAAEVEGEPDGRLCLTIDAFAGTAHAAPGDAVRRFGHMAAACATIAALWPSLRPPANAVL